MFLCSRAQAEWGWPKLLVRAQQRQLAPPPPPSSDSTTTRTSHHHTTRSAEMYAGFGFLAAYSPAPPLDFATAPAAPPLPQGACIPVPMDDTYAAMPLIADTSEIAAGHLGNMVQPSLVSEYDLGGEGDLFKAPEPFIDDPLLSLDPVAAGISMMSDGEAAMDETIKATDIGTIQNDPLLSEVLYECEKELMEKSAIEETISELLDVKIPMLQVEEMSRQAEEPLIQVELSTLEKEKSSIPECSLQKSVSSGCLNSADWINGPIRPNFLDFQGLDFETAFGMRRAYSEGDIQNLGTNTPRPVNAANVQSSCERLVTISDLKTEERKQKLSRYRKKKIKRNFGRKIKYACRKTLADSQPRVRGRFAKIEGCDLLKPKK